MIRRIEIVIHENENVAASQFDSVKTRLECLTNVLEENIDPTDEQSPFLSIYHRCVLALRKMCSVVSTCTLLPVNFPTVVMMTGLPGRPKVRISFEFYELMREAGYTITEIANVFDTSRATLWRQLKENNICISKFSEISDSALDYIVRQHQERTAPGEEPELWFDHGTRIFDEYWY